MIGFGVKFDHPFARHEHRCLSKSCCDAAIMPPSAKSVHGLLASSQRPEFQAGALFLGSDLVLWRLLARHKIQPAAPYADQGALAFGGLDWLFGEFNDAGLRNGREHRSFGGHGGCSLIWLLR